MRRRAALLCCALIAGCEHQVFDHARAAAVTAPDGGTPAPSSCDGAEDGARCDDHDACTASSACRDGACVAGNVVGDCTIADSAAEFGETQGENGWFYGYWNATQDEDGTYGGEDDFVEMDYCGESTWRPAEVCGFMPGESGYRWTSNLAWGLQHPETNPDIEVPIRRWVSDVSGPATLSIEHEVGGDFSTGTRALLLADDVEIFRHDSAGNDTEVFRETQEIDLAVGMVFDQLVHPLEDSADDTTYFTIRMEGR